MLVLSADPSTTTYATLEKYAHILTLMHVTQLPELWCYLGWITVILFHYQKKISSAFRNSKVMQPVSFTSSQKPFTSNPNSYNGQLKHVVFQTRGKGALVFQVGYHPRDIVLIKGLSKHPKHVYFPGMKKK